MRNRQLRLVVTLILCAGFIYIPVLQAAQISLPSGDLIAPELSHEVIPDTLEAGASVQIKVTVTDNVGVKSVTLFYRTKGTQDYKRANLNRIDNTDEYAVTLGKDELVAPGIEYYIQAMDLAGNTVLQGYSFSPLNISVLPPTAPSAKEAESVAEKAQPSPETIREESKPKKKSKTWLWIGLGALAVGAIAAAAGGGSSSDSGSNTGTVVVSGPSP